MSGIGEYDPADYPDVDGQELEEHWNTFQDFDLDNSGFITIGNLAAILDQLDCSLTVDAVQNMVSEVAFLCGHDNDGKLSFRDFVRCMAYEKEREVHNAAIDAAEELNALGIEDPDDRDKAVMKEDSVTAAALKRAQEPPEPEPEPSQPDGAVRDSLIQVAEALANGKWRGASIMGLLALAKPRLRANAAAAEAAALDAAEALMNEEPATVKESVKAAPKSVKDLSFSERLAKFKRIETAPPGMKMPSLDSEDIHKATLKNKLAAFEAAKSKAKDPVIFKKTWKIHHHGAYNPGKKFFSSEDGQELKPPPPRRLSALLRG